MTQDGESRLNLDGCFVLFFAVYAILKELALLTQEAPMSPKALSFLFLVFTISAFAQDQSGAIKDESQSRAMLLKKMVAQDRGEITAMEPSTKEDGGVVIGYASGAVVTCDSDMRCREFGDTPSVPVEQLTVSKNGASEIIWVTYRYGALYQCVNSQCGKFMQHDALQE